MLLLAAAAESDSEHPLARAIVVAGANVGERFRPQPSSGRSPAGVSRPTIDGHRVAVGGPALLRERDLVEPADLSARIAEWQAHGASVLYVATDDQIVGALALEDEIRPESRAAVTELHDLGVRVVMITGDARQVADAVAAELGIDEVFAEVLPAGQGRTRSSNSKPVGFASRWSATA